MNPINLGSRRAVLKAGVAMLAFTGAGAALNACSPAKPAEPAAAAIDPNPIAETKYGKVKGFLEDGVSGFKGVRYGADTSGANRFMPPVPVARWAGVRDATAYGNFAHKCQPTGAAPTPTSSCTTSSRAAWARTVW